MNCKNGYKCQKGSRFCMSEDHHCQPCLKDKRCAVINCMYENTAMSSWFCNHHNAAADLKNLERLEYIKLFMD